MTGTLLPHHPFDAAIELEPIGEGSFAAHTTPAYANMVGPFGGITAATALRAIQRHPQRLGEPISLTVNYAGPITDGPFEIAAQPTRTNRSTQHWTVSLIQDGAVTTTATAVFGNRRQTWTATEVNAPAAPPAETIAPVRIPDFLAWPHNYEMRFVQGGLPSQTGAQANSTSTLWVRDLPPRPLDYPALTALCDVFFPRVMQRLGRIVPAGTVSMTVYFHADEQLLATQSDRPVLATAGSQHFGNGFFDQSAQLWTDSGAMLATSHQLVYFKD
ncbi:acyl-CoA thioesterase [Nocardia sp. NPDC052566]|uniref:acyl-CoA thioesterase n=1 Tax=Nocardia sp. NPDC052566 TaxID=3364330 RepID=UPI0037C8B28F